MYPVLRSLCWKERQQPCRGTESPLLYPGGGGGWTGWGDEVRGAKGMFVLTNELLSDAISYTQRL